MNKKLQEMIKRREQERKNKTQVRVKFSGSKELKKGDTFYKHQGMTDLDRKIKKIAKQHIKENIDSDLLYSCHKLGLEIYRNNELVTSKTFHINIHTLSKNKEEFKKWINQNNIPNALQ